MSPSMDRLDFSTLERQVGDRLLRIRSPLRACLPGGDSARCAQALANLRNPYAIEDDPGAFHTTGWLGAFDAGHSPVAVAAETPDDIAAAVDFARDHGLELVIKGTGHDYLGRSSAPARPGAFSVDVSVSVVPSGSLWDASAWDAIAPGMVCPDDRPDQPPGRFWWATNQGEVSQYLHAYQSRWLPLRLFHEAPDTVAGALFGASRHWGISLHLNKGLCGAAAEAVARDRATAINPAVFDVAALVITGSMQQYAYPGVPGYEPDLALAGACARRVGAAMDVIRALTPDSGSYVNETDYFEPNWQQSLWGANYARLAEIKRAYDPANLFRVHHGVLAVGEKGGAEGGASPLL